MSEKENYQKLSDYIEDVSVSSIAVLDMFVNYLGLQVITDDFIKNLVREGYEIPGFVEETDEEDEEVEELQEDETKAEPTQDF